MNYTKEAKKRIKNIIHTSFGDFIPNIQLSEEDYQRDLERIAIGILAETASPDMYEALKAMLEGSEIAPLQPYEPIRVWQRAMPTEDAILSAYKALSKADGK